MAEKEEIKKDMFYGKERTDGCYMYRYMDCNDE